MSDTRRVVQVNWAEEVRRMVECILTQPQRVRNGAIPLPAPEPDEERKSND